MIQVATVLDLHSHSEASEDSRAPVEAYLNWIKMRRARASGRRSRVSPSIANGTGAPTIARSKTSSASMVLKAAEVETDYGHMLVFGVTDEMAQPIRLHRHRIPAQTLVDEVAGWVASSCRVIRGVPTSGSTSTT